MPFVTDPDNLDRSQVVFNTDQELIYLKGVGTLLESGADASFDADNPAGGTHRIDSAGSTFVTNGVQVNDIVVMLTGSQNAGHWSVSAVNSETQLEVQALAGDESTPVDELTSDKSFEVRDPTGGTLEPASATLFNDTGVSLQALYSFSKEEWRTDTALISNEFPFEGITREQMEIGGGSENSNWDLGNDVTKELIRTGGWDDRNTAGTLQRQYAGIITLGSLDSDAQVYYQQAATGAGSAPADFVRTGPVNQGLLVFTDGGNDFRSFLKIFVRKKARTYVQSEIADIGVTTIEALVNRFPLTHSTDPAIVDDDARTDGAAPYFTAIEVATGTNATLADVDTVTGTLTAAGENFDTTVLAGDIVEIKSGAFLGNYFEVISVDSATQLTLDTSENGPFTGETNQTYDVDTPRVRDTATDGALADVDGDTGTVTSASSTFNAADSRGVRAVAAGDFVVLAEGAGNHDGAYEVISVDSATQLTVDTSDREFTTQSAIDFFVGTPGMYLESKTENRTQVSGVNITFNENSPSDDTIVRASGSFVTDGYEAGDLITVAGAANAENNGNFTVKSVAALTLTLNSTEDVVQEGPSVGVTIDGVGHFARTGFSPETTDVFPFKWRLKGNSQSLQNCFQFIQRQLRIDADIDLGPDSNNGKTTDLLMSFVDPNGTGLDLYIDDLLGSDINNSTFVDANGTTQTLPFTAGVTINVSQTLIDDAPSNRVVVYFDDPDGTPSSGDEYGTSGAIIVDDFSGTDMDFTNVSASPISTDFDYDGNTQGGRTAGTDAPCTVVAIGLDNAQFAIANFTIQRQNSNPVTVVTPLERNYSNP